MVEVHSLDFTSKVTLLFSLKLFLRLVSFINTKQLLEALEAICLRRAEKAMAPHFSTPAW